jgi:hypothetical protein
VNPLLKKQMSVLPGLRPVSAAPGACKACGGPCSRFGCADFNKFCHATGNLVLGRSNICVEYERCGRCGFVFTRFCDDWTPQEFSRFIYNEDYVLVDPEYAGARPQRLAEGVSWLLGPSDLPILDYGSGAGHFGRFLMAKGRHRVTSYDPFASPSRPTGTFDVITCSEVLEHSPDPEITLRDLLGFLAPGGIVLATTACQPPEIESLGTSWWYIAPRNGHVSIYTDNALSRLVAKFGLVHRPIGGWHAFHGDGLLQSSKDVLERLKETHKPAKAVQAAAVKPFGNLLRTLMGSR